MDSICLYLNYLLYLSIAQSDLHITTICTVKKCTNYADKHKKPYGHTDFCMAVGLFYRVLNAKVHYLGCARVVFLGHLDGPVRYRIVVELL